MALIPVTVLTGFLGAGKTTLLNRLLRGTADKRCAVIVNEYGQLGVDGSLVVGAEEEVYELNNGCAGRHSKDVSSVALSFAQPLDRSGLDRPWAVDEARETRLVFIGRGLDADEVRDELGHCLADALEATA